jgi:hypothetical protein
MAALKSSGCTAGVVKTIGGQPQLTRRPIRALFRKEKDEEHVTNALECGVLDDPVLGACCMADLLGQRSSPAPVCHNNWLDTSVMQAKLAAGHAISNKHETQYKLAICMFLCVHHSVRLEGS